MFRCRYLGKIRLKIVITLFGFFIMSGIFNIKIHAGENVSVDSGIMLKGINHTVTQSRDQEKIKEKILNSCGLDQDWTVYMALNGYVCGDYLYFLKSDGTVSGSVYRIGVGEKKAKVYIKNVWMATYQNGFIIYKKDSQAVYVRNLTTGKKIKLASGSKAAYSNIRNSVVIEGDYIYYTLESNDMNKLYSVKTDGTDRRRIASKLPRYRCLAVYDGKIFYSRHYKKNGDVIGYKLYYTTPKETKLVARIKTPSWGVNMPYDGELKTSNGDLLFQVEMPGLRENHILYRFNGKTFKKIGTYGEFPEYYDSILSDGYRYRSGKNTDESEQGSGLTIERSKANGEWETFSYLPYAANWEDISFEMHNGYLVAYLYDEEPWWVLVFDKNGDLLVAEHIAGLTDEAWMYATVIGEKAYILHQSTWFKDGYIESDKCDVIDLNEVRKFYAENGKTTLKDIKTQFEKEMQKDKVDYKPGTDEYLWYVERKLKEINKDATFLNKDTLLLRMYMDFYVRNFREFSDDLLEVTVEELAKNHLS